MTTCLWFWPCVCLLPYQNIHWSFGTNDVHAAAITHEGGHPAESTAKSGPPHSYVWPARLSFSLYWSGLVGFEGRVLKQPSNISLMLISLVKKNSMTIISRQIWSKHFKLVVTRRMVSGHPIVSRKWVTCYRGLRRQTHNSPHFPSGPTRSKHIWWCWVKQTCSGEWKYRLVISHKQYPQHFRNYLSLRKGLTG